ncbi:MAG TPA: NAD-dependent epimerase/dehydratase family protein [Micromonosporaceae bacterium]|nr:NAD-dependent epimerase/dehydratase family protein [Micromonosporaceae bacterium]
MRIAITGATGNVGTALLRRLANEPDIEVVGLVRRVPGPEADPPYDTVTWHSVDVGDPASVEQLAEWFEGVAAVVHLAWQVQPSHLRAQLRRTNLNGARHVFDAAQRAGVQKLIYGSSVGVYAPGPKDRYVDESWPTTGIAGSGYSVDKATVEAMLDGMERTDSGIRVVRMRTALVFQHDVGAEMTRYFLGPFARFTLRRASPIIPVNGQLRIQAVHADDVAEAYLGALRRDVQGAFNLAAAPVLDSKVLADEMGGWTIPMTPRAVRALVTAAWRAHIQPAEAGWFDLLTMAPLLDCSRAERMLDWHPRYDARQALRELLDGIAEGAGMNVPPLQPVEPASELSGQPIVHGGR